MSTTPPTKPCENCAQLDRIDGMTVAIRNWCHTHPAPGGHATGVVAAEADKAHRSGRTDHISSTDFGSHRTGPAPTAEAKCPECGRTDKSAPCLTCNPTPPAATDDEVMAILGEFVGKAMMEDPVTFRLHELAAALEAHYAAKESAAYDSGFNNGYDEADMLWRVALETGLKITVQAENQFAAVQEIEAAYAAKERERVVKMQTELVDPFIDPDFGTVDIKGVGEATMAYIDRLLAERKEGR